MELTLLTPVLFLLLLLACFVGVIYPYLRNSKRWHFALAAVASFIGLAATVPKPTPEELAARKIAEAREAHEAVLKKALPVTATPANYTRAEYGETYDRVGAASFAKLGELEPGAAYVAAESEECDRVTTAMVSDMSSKGMPVWFVDCENENRFMVTQKQAEEALARHRQGKLVQTDLKPSCTFDDIWKCKGESRSQPTTQEVAQGKEVEYATACDLILEQVVVSPSSLDTKRWQFRVINGKTAVIERPFDSQNGFGAMIRSTYRCEIDIATSNIKGFSVRGPMGNKKFI
ncbi:hypothetical protein [Erythrobacter sp. WG]|uniref:hypothetical protein n=1 Tax=Erythrobacter sp. WG TaxID=2985510 RepID=UPI00226EDF38|nr:hypothetical protein [Erythrobacter sp. WG]MCX9147475.1 hypothetical protein [Erythrobacter sp. WG]